MMLNRRDLIRNGALLSACGGLTSLSATAAPPGVWLIDRQMSGAPAIAATARVEAAEVHHFAADPGHVWMHVIAPRLKQAPFSFGGYTSASVLFCLHYMARASGMKLAGLAEGMRRPGRIETDPDALIDLRDPRFSNHRTAYSWLMIPGRA